MYPPAGAIPMERATRPGRGEPKTICSWASCYLTKYSERLNSRRLSKIRALLLGTQQYVFTKCDGLEVKNHTPPHMVH